jgi:hypothetical protein
MQWLAKFAMQGRLQAALLVAGFAVSAAILPPIVILSGATLALVTLRKGPVEGALLMAVATAAGGALAWLAVSNPQLILVALLVHWIPLWLVAGVLRATVSLSQALLVLAGLGMVAVLVVHAALGDPTAWWASVMEQVLPLLLEQMQTEVQPEAIQQQIELLAPKLTGIVVSQLVTLVMLSLLLGRWWQAGLYNPGGFGTEFRRLRMGQVAAVIVLAGFGMAVFAKVDLLMNVVLAVALVTSLFGLSILHSLVMERGLSRGWLYGAYVLLGLLMYPVVTFLSILGAADQWLDLRQRYGKGANPQS